MFSTRVFFKAISSLAALALVSCQMPAPQAPLPQAQCMCLV
jgi:hypothetical protein